MNVFVSLVRTGVPALVGWLVTVAAGHGLDLDPQALSGVLVPVVTFAYYAVFRLAEQHVDARFGWLLGYARPPRYAAGKAPLPTA